MAGFQPDPPLTYINVIDQIAEAGFAGTELGDWGFMPSDPSVLGPELFQRDLAMVGAFIPVELTDPGNLESATAAALRVAGLLASVALNSSEHGPYVILAADASRHPERRQIAGRVTPEDGLNEEEWGAVTRGAGAVARSVHDETGLTVVFHPHCATPIETMAETMRFAEMTDPSMLGLCFDTGHVAYAGDDIGAWLSVFASRTSLVHFKDMNPEVAARCRRAELDYSTAVREGLFCPLGEGCVDFGMAHDWLMGAGYQGWIVVEDEIPPGRIPPFEAAKRDRDFLRKLGL
jgi:inosose dehydratase